MDPKDLRPTEWRELDVEEILRRLTAAGVDFVVIGGMALVLAGSARLTRDLDIVFASDDENLEALGGVLTDLDAKLREVDEELPFVADAQTLRNVELLTLTTSAGWLDVHRNVEGAPSYDRLRVNADRVRLGDFAILVAAPDDMIAMKHAAGRPQDIADIAEWEAIKRQRARLKRR